MSALSGLQVLDLSSNAFEAGAFPTLHSSVSGTLFVLALYDTNRTGAFPNLSSYSKLWVLVLGANNFTAGAFPTLHADVSSTLTHLVLDNTNRTGAFPNLSSYSKLEFLYLGANNFTAGAFPTLHADVSSTLTVLGLNNTNRNGAFPTLSGYSKLQHLDLGDNAAFTAGTFPALHADVSSTLTWLDLGSTNRNGAFPTLSSYTKLEHLDLSDNASFTQGSIPDLSALADLSYLSLRKTNRNGSIPATLGQLTNLTYLDLSENALTGNIPSQLGNLRHLTHLYLNNNQLTGSLPSGLNRSSLIVRLGSNSSDFGRQKEISIATTADTLDSSFATFNGSGCGTVLDVTKFPASPTLREAMIYANNTTAAETISFAQSLSGQTITLADGTDTDSNADPLPVLCGGKLTLDGDIDDNGSPDITLDGGTGGTGLASGTHGLFVLSSHNTITGLRLTNIPGTGIILWHTTTGLLSLATTMTNNTLSANTVTGGTYGLVVQAGDGTTAGAVSQTTLRGNTISGTSQAGIAVFTKVAGSTISTTTIEQNEVYDNDSHGIAVWSEAANTARTNSITGLTIQDNHIHDHTGGAGIRVVSGLCEGDHNRIQATISDNTLSTNGKADSFADIEVSAAVTSGCASTPTDTTQNHLDVTIEDNVSEDTPHIGIAVSGGVKSSDTNTVTATVARNAVWRSATAGIRVVGGADSSDSNAVTATLNDNLIARTTALTSGNTNAGHGLALVAAAAEPSDSTSSDNTLTIKGQGNIISIARNTSDTTGYDLYRRRNNDTTNNRTGNTVTDTLTNLILTLGCSAQCDDDDGTQDDPFTTVTPLTPVTIPTGHGQVDGFTFTLASAPVGASLPSGTQVSVGGQVFTITMSKTGTDTPITDTLDPPVQVCLPIPVGVSAGQAYLLRYDPTTNAWERLTAKRTTTGGQVCTDVSQFSLFTVGKYSTGTTGGGTGDGGRGDAPGDQHGDTPETASFPRIGGTMRGYIQSTADVDYFRIDVPAPGILSVRTTGTTNTTGQLEQDGVVLATDDNSGDGNNFRIDAPVTPGVYYVAVRGRTPGPYTLVVRLVQGRLETPTTGTTSAQSGLSVLRGWVCEADLVEIELERADGTTYLLEPAYGTARGDTASTCGGESNTGFGLLWNWNILGEGSYTVRALADDIVFGEATVTVTMPDPSEEYLTDVSGQTVVADFPEAGQEVRLVWSQSLQNFSLTTPDAVLPPRPAVVSVPWGTLENPAAGSSFQSGLGVISGWVCEAEAVILEVTTEAGMTYELEMAYGTARADAAERCEGNADIGFGLLFNWNLFGAGVHTLRALADGEEFGRAAIRVTTLGSEYLTGVSGQAEVVDFPAAGQTTTLEWQEAAQNFVITGVE